MRLNVRAFALTCGLLMGLGLFFVTLWIIAFDGASGEITFVGRVYRGYNISYLGSVYGLIWGFFDGLIGGAILAGLYNLITGRLTATKG
jgi:hypothetical protein